MLDMHVCPMVTGVVPHVGGPILVGKPTVLIGMMPAATLSSTCVCVGPPDVVIATSTVMVMNMPLARLGDSTAHGGTVILGCFTVLAG